MGNIADIIVDEIRREIEREREIQHTFLRVACLFETHYQRRPSSLLDLFPDLRDQALDEMQLKEIKQTLLRFVHDCPGHPCVPSAVHSLALSRDRSLKDFLVSQLRLHLEWQNTVVVAHLLAALEDLGENVFYDADGRFIGSRSSHDWNTNSGVARRFLENYDKAAKPEG